MCSLSIAIIQRFHAARVVAAPIDSVGHLFRSAWELEDAGFTFHVHTRTPFIGPANEKGGSHISESPNVGRLLNDCFG